MLLPSSTFGGTGRDGNRNHQDSGNDASGAMRNETRVSCGSQVHDGTSVSAYIVDTATI